MGLYEDDKNAAEKVTLEDLSKTCIAISAAVEALDMKIKKLEEFVNEHVYGD